MTSHSNNKRHNKSTKIRKSLENQQDKELVNGRGEGIGSGLERSFRDEPKRQTVQEKEKSKCKDLREGTNLACWKNNKEADVAGLNRRVCPRRGGQGLWEVEPQKVMNRK